MRRDEVEKMLNHINADDRLTWIKVGTALKTEYGDSGLDMFDRWSSQSAKYDPKILKQQWKSFQVGKVTLGTVVFLAKQNGYVYEPKQREYTPQEKSAYRQMQQQRNSTENVLSNEISQDKINAIAECKRRWENARPASQGHPYLSRKGIDTPYIRRILKVEGDKLLIPIRSYGEIKGLQEIHPNGFKQFPKGCSVKGNAFFIGSWDKVKNDKEVVVAEGLATGVSVHLATNKTVVIAFNGHNLADVVSNLSEKHDLNIVIAADNDKSRSGHGYAQKAIDMVGANRCQAVFPTFLPEHSKFNDWNDYFLQYEQSEVKDMVKEPMRDIFERAFEWLKNPEAVKEQEMTIDSENPAYQQYEPSNGFSSQGKPPVAPPPSNKPKEIVTIRYEEDMNPPDLVM